MVSATAIANANGTRLCTKYNAKMVATEDAVMCITIALYQR